MKKVIKIKGYIFIIMVIITICTVGCFIWQTGVFFIELVSDPVSLSSDVKVEAENEKEVLNLDEIQFFTCQVGLFKEKDNADKLVAYLEQKGQKAQIIQDKLAIVVVGFCFSKNDAEELGSKLKQDGIDNVVKNMSYSASCYKVGGNEKEIITNLLKIANLILTDKDYQEIINNLPGGTDFFLKDNVPDGFEKLSGALEGQLSVCEENQTDKVVGNSDLLLLYIEYSKLIHN
ncbi:MAG: SPOR domain-containing protein [Eubacteriales bacterium]